MHKRLQKQLNKLQIDSDLTDVDVKKLHKLIKFISKTYDKHDTLISQVEDKQNASNTEIHTHYLYKEKENKRHFHALISSIPDLMYLLDKNGYHLEVYAEGKEHLLVKPKKELLYKPVAEVYDSNLADKMMHIIHATLKTEQLQTIEFELRNLDEIRYFEARAVPSGLKGKHKNTVIIMTRDITAKKNLESNARLINTVFQEATEGIIIEDKHRKVIHANNAMGMILGIPTEELIGKHSDYLSTMISQKTQKSIYDAMTKHGFWHGEVEVTPPNAKKVYCWLTLDAIFSNTKELNNIVLMITDISAIHQSKNQLQYLASYDTLTDLPNRSLLFKQLKKSIASMQRKKTNGMLLFIDIDHFKEFNDSYGHQVGDKVLLSVAQKITSVCREEDILGRLSGDEFLLISEDINDQNAINSLINKIRHIFKSPQQIDNLSLHISVSIGIALYPENGQTPEALINAADQAMYAVKKEGRNNYAFYSQEMSNIANEYFFILNALKDAIQTENFMLLYQPQYSLQSEEITTIEVLLRCTHSRISHIPIPKLISIAEETGIICDISKIVLEMMCQQIHLWELSNISLPYIAMNLSKKELSNEHLLVTIHNTLTKYNLSHQNIELEITESAILQENVIVKDNITRLQKLGHSFSIDDYGTGFSSLSNIKTFEFDKLKIDKSFIKDLCINTDDQIIVSATIGMAKQLGLKVVAEGVETKDQMELLKKFGCDIIQGFFYSKPLDSEDIKKLLIERFKGE